jgi:hypothetical protein
VHTPLVSPPLLLGRKKFVHHRRTRCQRSLLGSIAPLASFLLIICTNLGTVWSSRLCGAGHSHTSFHENFPSTRCTDGARSQSLSASFASDSRFCSLTKNNKESYNYEQDMQTCISKQNMETYNFENETLTQLRSLQVLLAAKC